MDQLRVFMRSNTTEKEVLFLSIEHGYHTCVRRILPTSRYLVISVSKSRQYFRSFWRSVVRPLALFLLMVSLHSRSSQHCTHNTPLDYFQHLHKHWYIHTHTHAQISTHTHWEIHAQTFYLTQSQYTDTGPTSPSADPITPGAWQGSHWSANF